MLPQPNDSDAPRDGTPTPEQASPPPGETAQDVPPASLEGPPPPDVPAASADSEASAEETEPTNVSAPAVTEPDATAPDPPESQAPAVSELPVLPPLKEGETDAVKNVTTKVSAELHKWLVDEAAKSNKPLWQITEGIWANIRTYLQAYQQFGRLQSIVQQYEQVGEQLRQQNALLDGQALTIQADLKAATLRSEQLQRQIDELQADNEQLRQEQAGDEPVVTQLQNQLRDLTEQLRRANGEIELWNVEQKEWEDQLATANQRADKADEQLSTLGQQSAQSDGLASLHRTELLRLEQGHAQTLTTQKGAYEKMISDLIDHMATMPTGEAIVPVRERRTHLRAVASNMYDLHFAPAK